MLLENRHGNIVLAEWSDGTWLGRRVDTKLAFDIEIDWDKDRWGNEIVLTVFRPMERAHLRFTSIGKVIRIELANGEVLHRSVAFSIVPQFDADTDDVDQKVRDALAWTVLCWLGIPYADATLGSIDRIFPSFPSAWDPEFPPQGESVWTPGHSTMIRSASPSKDPELAHHRLVDSLNRSASMNHVAVRSSVVNQIHRVRYLLQPYDAVYVLELPFAGHEAWTLYRPPNLFGQRPDEIVFFSANLGKPIGEGPDLVELLDRLDVAIPIGRVESWIEEHATSPLEELDISIWVSFGQIPPPLWGRKEFLSWVAGLREYPE